MVLAIVSKKYHDPNKYLTDIYNGSMRWTGIPAIRIEGPILPYDDEKFAAVAARRQGSVVYLSSPGGSIGLLSSSPNKCASLASTPLRAAAVRAAHPLVR